MLPVWIALGVLVLIVIWVISLQRKLVSLEELCGNAMSSIGVQLATRWDALTSLVKLTEKYAQHEDSVLTKVVGLRRAVGKSASAQEVDQQENALQQTLSQLIAVSEAYPQLKADGVYQNTMDGLKGYEDQVRKSRMVYNDTVTKLNRMIKMFPNNIFAGLLGFRTREYLAADPAKMKLPEL